MPVTAVTKDPVALTMTVVADFAVPLQRLWDAYADPRQIEKFWGPPEWPATFTRHDMAEGGRSHYEMRGPDGGVAGGYWEFLRVDAPHGFEVLDGFATADGSPNKEMPTTRMVYRFTETAQGSQLTTTTHFNSLAELEQLIEMGMQEGLAAAMSQIDAVVADLRSYAAGIGTQTQILSDTQVRISRIIRGSIDAVWRAYNEPELIKRWLLGPDGWTMPVCDMTTEIGGTFRQEWQQIDGDERFGFTGELLEIQPPVRSVTTERMIGTDGPGTLNELTLTPVDGGTLVATVITYPDAQMRDAVLATGMADGMEASYARMESDVLTPA